MVREEVERMFIRLSKLTGENFHRSTYINPDQIVWYGPINGEEDKTIIHFTNDKKNSVGVVVGKSPKEVCEILTECGVEVWR